MSNDFTLETNTEVYQGFQNLSHTVSQYFDVIWNLAVTKRFVSFFFPSEELKLGFEKVAAFPGMQAVALGTKENNIRATLPPSGLSVEKQVDCLLDQAMDPNVLGRVWVGWEPWMWYRC